MAGQSKEQRKKSILGIGKPDFNPFDNIGRSLVSGMLEALSSYPPLEASAKGKKVKLVIGVEVTFQVIPVE